MLAKVASHASYANVMATLAVFISLGGGAYAMTIPKNSIGAAQIKKNAVGASEIKTGAVRSVDVANGSLLGADFKAGELPAGPRGLQGPQGPEGPRGVQGLQGDKGEDAVVPPVDGMHSPFTLLNGFAMYDENADGTADVPVQFWKDPAGVVHLQGAVERASVPADFTQIFQLPVGYRPAAGYVIFPVMTLGHTDTDEQLGNLQISSDGFVWYDGGKVGYFSFDGVTFRAA